MERCRSARSARPLGRWSMANTCQGAARESLDLGKAAGHGLDGRRVPGGLRIRRLGVRIPSGALVETATIKALTSRRAGQGLERLRLAGCSGVRPGAAGSGRPCQMRVKDHGGRWLGTSDEERRPSSWRMLPLVPADPAPAARHRPAARRCLRPASCAPRLKTCDVQGEFLEDLGLSPARRRCLPADQLATDADGYEESGRVGAGGQLVEDASRLV